MKKKGFTLIELLAVIVILAIIALIATPIVMNVIENSKKGAAERSAENYMNAVETAVAEERIDGVVLEGEYTIQPDGSLCPAAGCGEDDKDKVLIEMSGNKPASGTINIANGLVTTESTMTVGDYNVSYDETKKTYVAKKANPEDENTSVVVYRWSEEEVNIGAELSSFTYVENPSDLGKDYYLKHVVENNVVTETWACAVLNGEKACVRGGKDENGNYYANSSILEDLNTKGLCDDYDELHGYCGVGSVGFTVGDTVTAGGGDGSCSIGFDGSSMCEIW